MSPNEERTAAPGLPGLEVEGLRKRFGPREVLRGCALRLDGGALAVLGGNGAGKSTLLAILAGLVPPDPGSALSLGGVPLTAQRAQVGYVPESLVPFADLRAGEFLALVAALKHVQAPASVGEPPAHLSSKSMGALSLGERRRVCLAAALLGAPRLLLLDEPSNGLDAEARAAVLAVLRRHLAQGGLVLLATHDLTFADALGAARVVLADGLLSKR
jgi:ABC-type multidrug transport system ATPase subunit